MVSSAIVTSLGQWGFGANDIGLFVTVNAPATPESFQHGIPALNSSTGPRPGTLLGGRHAQN